MLHKLKALVRDFGAAAASVYLADRALRACSPRFGLFHYELMEQPVGVERLLPESKTRDLAFAEIGPGHEALRHMPVPEEVKAARFAQGARCLGVYRKNAFIGYVWLCFGGYAEDEVRCVYDLSLAERSAWDFDLYLLPEHRMGTGFLAIWHGAFEYLSQRGIERSFSRVSRFNLASRRAHARLGSVCVGRLWALKLGGVQLLWTTVGPRVGASWKSDQAVRIRLKPRTGVDGISPLRYGTRAGLAGPAEVRSASDPMR